jgi:hypothetical protein
MGGEGMKVFGCERLFSIGVIALLGLALGCASSSHEEPPLSTWYVGSPDFTWEAIHVSLEKLGYDVETENRENGTLRAGRPAGNQSPASVLQIDQIMRTDAVKIYVRAQAAPDGASIDQETRQKLAQEYLTALNKLLYKESRRR